MAAPKEIVDLVERFISNIESYKSSHYNETQVRREFVDPFFKALGWDIDNEQGFAEAYKDVIHEDAIKVGGTTRAPDYSFRIGGQRKFFLETKKPSVDIKDDIHPAFQLRRYAWTAKLPLSILTDFEEFSVYDCGVKPDKTDKPSKGRILYLTYQDFLTKWDEIASIFSKNAILKGSFDKFAADKKGKRGTAEVDAAFLEEIAGWREILAKNIALRNPDISTKDLNYAVQAIVNRIVFLRICEDRGIERLMKLQDLLNGERVYPRLCEFFRRADERYNSGIFHFEREPGRESPDTLTLNLNIDDKPLKEIIKRLYYPDSPYEFSVLPAEILGQVYEQFLGKVIRLTEGHRAVVEDKPEVKKAGGVKYTPVYIVVDIVGNTLGRILKGKTPHEVVLITVLDPACGSGSFLIVAYQYLLDWHRDWYVQNLVPLLQSGLKPSSPEIRQLLPGVETGKKGRKKETELPIYQGRGGEWRLTTAERKRILLNNIYGVDIDRQAVEVTKLSLLLKVLEGENEETISKQLTLFQERALPDLSQNIKCGNSLIGWDILEYNPTLTQEEIEKINPFDWEKEFKHILQRGGFSVIIGNPPYGALYTNSEIEYLRQNYLTLANSLDSFLLFVELTPKILSSKGMLGIIIPSGWVSTPSSMPLRKFFLSNYRPREFVSLPFDIFHNTYIDTIILIAEKSSALESNDDIVDLVVFPSKYRISGQDDFLKFCKKGQYLPWLENKNLEFLITSSAEETNLIQRLANQSNVFGDFVLVKRGIETYHPVSDHNELQVPFPAFTGTLQRYNIVPGKTGFISYINEIQKSKPIEYFSEERILLRQVLSRKLRLQASIENEKYLTNQSVQSILLKSNQKEISLRYLLGILNSKLMSWYFRSTNSVARRDDFPKIIIKQTRELPFPKIDFADHQNLARHDLMVSLVEQMLTLHKQLQEARTPHDQTALQRQIEAKDRQIDALVYELYGLTEEEIKIVEGGMKP